MGKIRNCLQRAVELTEPELSDPEQNEEQYMKALEELVHAVEQASPSEMEAEKMDKTLEQSLILDQKLFPIYCKTIAECVSLMAAMAAYQLSLKKGLPRHSPVYMGWVAKLKKRIEAWYGTEVRNYS